MIEFASEKYREGIIALWQEAFCDEEEFINGFLDNMKYCENMLIYREQSSVFGMVTMLPVFCGENKGRYIYAVATSEKQRGKGICKNIMKAVDEFIIKEKEKFAILVPAGESLFEFYKKMGYNQIVYKPEFPPIKGRGRKLSIGEYFRLREKFFEKYDFIGWSEENLEYVLSFGETMLWENGAFYREGAEIKEALAPEIFDSEWEIPFGEIKYFEEKLKFDKPYFGLCIN
ncbi:MAG: GNAT family N-acetyltransferase [Ruminococcaceae bacterium]|nr:GNAT family N-acetyltransferase [Oscillospiraceae bacterium]